MTPGALPLVEDSPGNPPSLWSTSGQASAAGATVQAGLQAGPNEAGEHNTHLWVAGLMVLALALLIFLHINGFRFATDVGVTRG